MFNFIAQKAYDLFSVNGVMHDKRCDSNASPGAPTAASNKASFI